MSAAETARSADHAGLPEQPPRPRVLVCDDSAAARGLVQEVLEPACEVVLVARGEDAIRAARASPPDVVLCDLVMPGLTGADVLRVFRAEPSLAPIPFVFMTVRTDGDARAVGLEAGADDYLGKPLRPRELVARVASLVRLRRTMHALEERSRALAAANRRIHQTHAALVRAERLATLGTLAAGVAHAVNNPLAYAKSGAAALAAALDDIDRAARALADGTAGPRESAARATALAEALHEARGLGDEVRDGLRRIERLAADLRFFGSPGRPSDELVSAEDAVRAAWDVAHGRVAAAPRFALSADAVAPIVTSTKLLFQALLAMLEHALAAAGPTGEVAVAVAERGEGVEIAVGDDGPPLDAAVVARLFDGFTLGRAAGSTPGLGLAVARAIAHGLGGELDAASGAPRGTTLRLWLPRRHADADADA